MILPALRPIRTLACSLLLLVTSIVSPPAVAQFRAEGFVYSFMQTRTGAADNYVLVPVPTDAFRLDAPLNATVPSAFGLLKSAKVATYGNTSIVLTDADIQNRHVVVNVDPNVGANFDIIASETVLTFAGLGVQSVSFPGFRETPMTAADVTYAYYRLQLPLWQALSAGQVLATDVVLPDGSQVTASEAVAMITGGDPTIREAIFATLASPSPTVVYTVLGVIGTLGLDGYEQAVAPVLQTADPILRTAAVAALATSSEPAALDMLVQTMDTDSDFNVRVAAAQALAASPVESYRLYELFFRAAAPDPAIRVPALQQIATIDDPRVNERLVLYAADQDLNFAYQSIVSLVARSAWTEVQGLLGNDAVSPELRLLAADGLSRAADAQTAIAGISYLIQSGDETTGRMALTGLPRLGSSGLAALGELAQSHASAAFRALAIQQLGLAGTAAELSVLNAIAVDGTVDFALQRAARHAVDAVVARLDGPTVAGLAAGSDAVSLAASVVLLASQGAPEAAALVESALTGSSPVVRGAGARALGYARSEDAFVRLEGLVQDSDPWVRAQAIRGMGHLGPDFAARTAPALIQLIEAGEPDGVSAGVLALAELQQVALRGLVIDKLRFPDASVRLAAMNAALMLGEGPDPRDVLGAVAGLLRDADIDVRLAAARALGNYQSETSVLSLSNVANDPSMEMRLVAIEAIGRTRMPSAFSVLMTLLEDPMPAARIAAVRAMSETASAAWLPDLEAALGRAVDAQMAAELQALVERLRTGAP